MKPEWLKVRGSGASARQEVAELLSDLSLNTVCHEAACPNIGECFGRKTATFMILGIQCTRHCRFCNVLDGSPESVNLEEPQNLAKAVKRLKLKHVVVTSVTRDDLPDGGAAQFARTIWAIRRMSPETTIEVLIPDFKMNEEALDIVIEARPDIIAHNMETIESLYEDVRPEADYQQSLNVISYIKKRNPAILTKSGIMLGLGEEKDQVLKELRDLRDVACDFLTVGQYLAPTKEHHPVLRYIHPGEFKAYEEAAYEMGFGYVASGPLVRSSYHADEAMAAMTAY